MNDPKDSDLIREATSLFLRLRDYPEDEDLIRQRDRFLERGKAEREAYAKMLKVWKATETRSRSSASVPLLSLAFFAVIASAILWADDARIALLADHASANLPLVAELRSGDRATLDANSAIIEEVRHDARHITLMRGAAFFEVAPSDRMFLVTSNDLKIQVTGTAFEVGQLDDTSVVTVAEGSVQVSWEDRTWHLEAGDQWVWYGDGRTVITGIETEAAASWRDNLLVTDGLTLSQVAAIIDRRHPGPIVVMDDELGTIPIVGTFDLSNPEVALNTLAALEQAQVIRIPSVLTLVLP
ncbi:MAG: FecR domain-containing protein [Pseudomonadota bacterium]